jgi:hypothetical protein
LYRSSQQCARDPDAAILIPPDAIVTAQATGSYF